MTLPDKFQFTIINGRLNPYTATRVRGSRFTVSWEGNNYPPIFYQEEEIVAWIASGDWKIVEEQKKSPSLHQLAQEQSISLLLKSDGKIGVSLPMNTSKWQNVLTTDYTVKNEEDAVELLSLLKRIKELTNDQR
jgi:hypothetical protein